MIKLYLDIDGVLIGKKGNIPTEIEELLQLIIRKFDCYWLTTHCKGDIKTVISYLNQFYPEYFLKYWQEIKATNWDALKVEAIDFNGDFIWLDDQPLQVEKMILEDEGCLEKLIVVDLKKPDAVRDLMIQFRAI